MTENDEITLEKIIEMKIELAEGLIQHTQTNIERTEQELKYNIFVKEIVAQDTGYKTGLEHELKTLKEIQTSKIMRYHEYSTNVKKTLEKDIKKILIETKHITEEDKIQLYHQTIGIFPKSTHLQYYGTFKAIIKDDFIIGEFQARPTSNGLTHQRNTGKPLYNLRIEYGGKTIK